jgi:hypothetical protein
MAIVSNAAIEKLGLKRACEMADRESRYIDASRFAVAMFHAETTISHGHEWDERTLTCWMCGKRKEHYRSEIASHTAEWCKGRKENAQ